MPNPVPVIVPQMNPNDEHAVLVVWHVRSGERVTKDQILVTLETTKAAFDVNAPSDGYAFYRQAPKTMVAVGAAIAWISDDAVAPIMEESVREPRERPVARAGQQKFTRKALRLMDQHGVSEADFAGLERVEATDVERLVQQRRQSGQPAQRVGVSPLEQSSSKILEVARLGEVYRAAIPSMVSVAMSSELIDAKLAHLAEEMGSISLLELAIYEAARLLQVFPDLNGFYADGQAWRHDSVAIGFAINLGRSLRVPVVAGAAGLGQIDVARKVRDLSLRYMRGELTMEDVSGGTFTVTDLSVHGVVNFIPVLNEQQSAILGICAERPGTGHRDLIMSFDHRMADGMRAAAFLSELKARLEGAPLE